MPRTPRDVPRRRCGALRGLPLFAGLLLEGRDPRRARSRRRLAVPWPVLWAVGHRHGGADRLLHVAHGRRSRSSDASASTRTRCTRTSRRRSMTSPLGAPGAPVGASAALLGLPQTWAIHWHAAATTGSSRRSPRHGLPRDARASVHAALSTALEWSLLVLGAGSRCASPTAASAREPRAARARIERSARRARTRSLSRSPGRRHDLRRADRAAAARSSPSCSAVVVDQC